MISSSSISPSLVQSTLNKLNDAPYFLEQLNIQENPKTRRKTYSFGYNYFSMANKDYQFTHIPNYLKELCQACIDSFPQELNLGSAENYLNVIVSIYEKGYKLEPHVDADVERIAEGRAVDFHFDENILGVILEADSKGRLYFVKTDDESLRFTAGKVFELNEKSGTTYLMCGPSRHKPYYHGVSAVKKSRVSVTFRRVHTGPMQ